MKRLAEKPAVRVLWKRQVGKNRGIFDPMFVSYMDGLLADAANAADRAEGEST